MRRRPQKDQRKHQNAFDRHAARCRRPTDHWGEGTGSTANDDILRCPALEPHGVDYDVKENREGQKARRKPVRCEPKHDHGQTRQCDSQRLCFASGHFARWNRTLLRAAHDRVDIGIIPHIQRTRGTAAQRNEQNRGKPNKGMNRYRRGQQPDKGCKNNQCHDAWLEQGEVIAKLCVIHHVCRTCISHVCVSLRYDNPHPDGDRTSH